MLCPSQSNPIRTHVMSVGPIIDEVKFDHVILVTTADFLHCKRNSFSLFK